MQYENGTTRKKMSHEKSTTWKMCNAEKVQHGKVQHEMSATQKSATWCECNMEQHEKRCNRRRVQHTKKCNMNMVWHKKSATWKECNMKKCNTDKAQHEMSASQKKWHMKRVQHKATREKVQHEKSARVKYAKKMLKNSALEWKLDNGTSVDGPLYPGVGNSIISVIF